MAVIKTSVVPFVLTATGTASAGIPDDRCASS